ncbi:CusA/CzcA family heavy metal efflux RND transporter [Brumimicrobium glaciale]|uniref:CusA/CzcA family heavy metal efflux RND transporter n=1 Tax=Brumimicrobium glaciale TaxID=200475 RepID=A0A4Q4KRU7_9FLAO|nr:CusA/CzcA family heavy metal efflux RND transporter [Brumimicrobium glaciale]RYM36043.1 CusA/CzcA family heavy metal efflux RND transporter [Brumimicrobium glaciale]
MFEKIINFSLQNKLVVLLFTAFIIGTGTYSLMNIPIGAVPDITNNQVQVITTSRNLATQDVEKFLTYPVELEMANLPNVKEIRSVSKFGLSVVTIVFDDKIGTYLPRQLIAEKIKNAEEKIPNGFGTPFMGPITTGLGEIYQYVLDVDPEHKGEYSITELRTIQDWIVKRQLSGIPGVVEVNTWGGFLKQYEVAVDPMRLRSMDISISEIFTALENNNSVAGGGYIEKGNESYFIRGEGLANSIEDIENIVVTIRDNQPIYVKDIAKVGFGAANRFGAITGNGEGEKVLGQVMMLKGADSKKVIDAVKARVEEIESSLPEGVHINAFLERSELIAKTTFTVSENLILGCLIVIFVVVLLLGNLRSGLVVASVIPLCLAFALTLMYIFGVDANLMSLGAIDFGIIIDGAVIIVEFIAYKITSERLAINKLPKGERRAFIDKVTLAGTSKMMRSAVFGQIIIIIVFIPILSLVNVEGKMFRPMALVFCFALIGAMILCFTYVPVMASLFLKPTNPDKKNISTRLVGFLGRIYKPIIIWALRKKAIVLSGAGVLLVIVYILFGRMGGEFVPTLDEGDLVIQPVLKTGTSLTKTVETTTQIEKILMTFPEVKQVVSRIGAAEVPTDPMSMEESDVIVRLIPKKEWVTAQSKDELIDKFKEALTDIAGIDYEFTQPIEMRFNELITGVRADLAIKIFGEDLDVLFQTATEIEKAIQNVEGASDIIVEKVAGLPQMTVTYDRKKIGKYGLNIAELNNVLTMGFAGIPSGTIFEGEKQFDLVVRFDEENRKDISNIETTSIQLPNGNTLPFSEFATISYTKGPAKISRDNTKRRIVIGVNVRNRDLESVVKDVQSIVENKIQIPKGYTVEYGGQFENLRSAKDRLMVAVPIALLLIFFLLYFAFKSVKEALMIYSAIPLSAVGGVLFLYMRDLPFSISAGVGFIALFGIAVLNGIVLIEQFKELKAEGVTNINKRIIMGTQLRLRPVLLTASAAALGFLPMAISTNAGAEVQRPLATVVIGGLITATLLTLVVLPVLYAMFDKKVKTPKISMNKISIVVIFLSLGSFIQAQHVEVSLQEAIAFGIENNKGLKSSKKLVNMNQELEGTAYSIDKTDIYYSFDENNLAPNNLPLNVFGVSQTIRFPTFYASQKKVFEQQTAVAESKYQMDEQFLEKGIAKAYYTASHWQKMVDNYTYLDSIYQRFAEAALQKYEVGESNNLELLLAQSKSKEFGVTLFQSQMNYEKSLVQLNKWIQSDTNYTISNDLIGNVSLMPLDTNNNAFLQYLDQSRVLSEKQLTANKRNLMPDLKIGVYQGSNNGLSPNRFYGVQAGIAVPLFYGADRAKIKASKMEIMVKQNDFENYSTQIQANYQTLINELKAYKSGIDYYNNFGENLFSETLLNANIAYKAGEIDYLQYITLLDHANTIKINYLQNNFFYNLTVIEANHILN